MVDYGVDTVHLINTYKISIETLLPIMLVVTIIGIIGFHIRKNRKRNKYNKSNKEVQNNTDEIRCKISYELDCNSSELLHRLDNVPNEPKDYKKYQSLYMEFDNSGKKI